MLAGFGTIDKQTESDKQTEDEKDDHGDEKEDENELYVILLFDPVFLSCRCVSELRQRAQHEFRAWGHGR